MYDTMIAGTLGCRVDPGARPGALVITSGDHSIILASALAASRGVELAGLLLDSFDVDYATGHGAGLAGTDERIADPAYIGQQLRHRAACRRIFPMPCRTSIARMDTVLDAMAEQLDTDAISASFHPPRVADVAAGVPVIS